MEELAEDLDRLTKRVDRVGGRLDKLPFVRIDLFNAELRAINQRLDSMSHQLMAVLSILGSILVAVVVMVITAIARGGFG